MKKKSTHHRICQEAVNAKAADGDGPSALFSQGRGHMLPGRPEKQERQVGSRCWDVENLWGVGWGGRIHP